MSDESLARQNLTMNGAELPDDDVPLSSVPWEQLISARVTLRDASQKIVDMCEKSGRKLAGVENDAVDYALDMLEAINNETKQRDATGNRGPRASGGGRRTEPNATSNGSAMLGNAMLGGSDSLGRPRSNRMRDIFGAQRGNGNGGFRNFNEFFRTASANPLDSRLIRNATTGMTEGIGEEGGFMVPSSFTNDLWDAALEDEVIRPRADVYPVTTPTLTIGAVDTGGDHTTGDIAGLTVQWADEEAALTPQKVRIRPMNVRAQKGIIYVPISNELLEDGVNTERWLAQTMIDALSFGLDDSFINGNGVGRPLGILNSPSLIVQAKESSQSSATIITQNLLNMLARLHPRCERNAIWLVSPSARQYLYTISQEVGVNMPGVGRTVTSVGRSLYIMGIPVVVTEKLPVLGTQGDVVLCDVSQYLIAMRADLRLERSQHEKFANDVTSYRLKVRAGGQSLWAKAMTPRYGGATTTLSWAIALAVRP